MSELDIDQAKLFQTISLAVADAAKGFLESEQAKRICELEASVKRLERVIGEQRDTIIGTSNVCKAALKRVEAAEAEVERLKDRLQPRMDGDNGSIIDAVDLAEFREKIARGDAQAAEAKLRAVKGLPEKWRNQLQIWTADRDVWEGCAKDLEAALKEGGQVLEQKNQAPQT